MKSPADVLPEKGDVIKMINTRLITTVDGTSELLRGEEGTFVEMVIEKADSSGSLLVTHFLCCFLIAIIRGAVPRRPRRCQLSHMCRCLLGMPHAGIFTCHLTRRVPIFSEI